LGIHTENKPSTDCAQRWGVKEEMEGKEKKIQNCINQYWYTSKANVLVGNIKVDRENPWFRETV
jgi:hypothetical protein